MKSIIEFINKLFTKIVTYPFISVDPSQNVRNVIFMYEIKQEKNKFKENPSEYTKKLLDRNSR